MLTGTTILALSLAGGCSDDSETPEGDSSSSPTSAEDAGSKSRDCKVDVAVTGSSRATWKGKGQAQVDKSASPPAFYQASKGKNNISVYAAGEDFERSAVVTVNGVTYTTEQGADGVEAKPNGKRAVVDATATGIKPDLQVRVVATFTC